MKSFKKCHDIVVPAMKSFGLVIIALTFTVIASAKEVTTATTTCSEHDVEALSVDHVIVSDIGQGLFMGGKKFAIRCGTWSAEAIYEKSIPKISLLIKAGIGEPPPPVPADLAMRLFRLPLTRFFAMEGTGDRYDLAVQNYVGLGKRIAAAALASPTWDARHGHARSIRIGDFVKQLINEQNLHSELASLGATLGYRVRVSAVEEVPLCPATELSLPGGRRASGLVPCGGLVYFELIRQR